jgi:hypothetical protein
MRIYPAGMEDRHVLEETNDIALRFFMGPRLLKMKYGEAANIPGPVVRKAWHPTGDHDHSFAGAMRAISLSNSGNRPESSYTTEERIQMDLDDSFEVAYYPHDDQWIFRRKLACCPHCHGFGRVRKISEMPPVAFVDYMKIPFSSIEKVEYETCKHDPA